MLRLRTIVPENEVTFDVDAAKMTFSRVDDAYAGLEWRLARSPNDGILVGNGYYIYKQLGFPKWKIPSITVLYRFTDSEVFIEAIIFAP